MYFLQSWLDCTENAIGEFRGPIIMLGLGLKTEAIVPSVISMPSQDIFRST
jgi:hypothetical protein